LTSPALGAIVSSSQLSALFQGLIVSFKVSGLSLALGLPLGVLFAVLVSSRNWVVKWSALVVVEIGRGVPALVLLEFVYYGLPQKGIRLTSLTSAVVVIGFSVAAYSSENFRAAIRAVPKGQREAAASIGLSRWSTFLSVVFPQAARIALPQIMSHAILVFQASALAFTVALPELLSQAYNIGSETFRYMDILCVAGAIYAAVTLPISRLGTVLEHRLTRRL
jgi:polar amino acid transport system permease protein